MGRFSNSDIGFFGRRGLLVQGRVQLRETPGPCVWRTAWRKTCGRDIHDAAERVTRASDLTLLGRSLPYDKIRRKEVTVERDQIVALLKSRKRRLKKFGIHSLSIFGSVARNQAHKNSDVDILVDFDKPIGLFEYARLKMYLEEILERPVDLVTPEALRQELREEILREAIRAT
jgi:predicted nucleotidyltransferase